jgi:MOB kinase activator 1
MTTLPPNWMQSLQAGVQRIIDPNSAKTFRPRRQVMAGSRLDRLNTLAQRTLGTGNLREAVTLPPGEDLNEWLAVKTVDLFNEVNLVYGFVGDYCAPLGDPTPGGRPLLSRPRPVVVQAQRPPAR